MHVRILLCLLKGPPFLRRSSGTFLLSSDFLKMTGNIDATWIPLRSPFGQGLGLGSVLVSVVTFRQPLQIQYFPLLGMVRGKRKGIYLVSSLLALEHWGHSKLKSTN